MPKSSVDTEIHHSECVCAKSKSGEKVVNNGREGHEASTKACPVRNLRYLTRILRSQRPNGEVFAPVRGCDTRKGHREDEGAEKSAHFFGISWPSTRMDYITMFGICNKLSGRVRRRIHWQLHYLCSPIDEGYSNHGILNMVTSII